MTVFTYVVSIGIVKGIHYRRVLLPSAIGHKTHCINLYRSKNDSHVKLLSNFKKYSAAFIL